MKTMPFSTNDAAAVERAIRTRRTIQNYTKDRVDVELIRRGIELARWAPNHRHTEPWRFYLIGAATAERIVSRNTEIVRAEKGEAAARNKKARWAEIPHWLLLTCLRSDDAYRQQEDYAACCCAAQNLALFLWAHSVGMKWTSGPVMHDPEFLSFMGVPPEKELSVGLFQYGLAAEVPTADRSALETCLKMLP